MAERTWQVQKIQYCEHARREIALESEALYPAEIMPEQPPRIVAHRCTNALECNLTEKAACSLCGTNPDLNPT